MMACIISFSGVGGSYLQARAENIVVDALWNTEETAWSNISRYLHVFASAYGLYVSPSAQTALWGATAAADFLNFMISDGYTEEEANECVHGGGGHVRDGITQDENGNITYSDEVSDLFYGYICNYLETESGYWVVETMLASEIPKEWFATEEKWNALVETIDSFGICGLWLASASTGKTCNSVRIFYRPSPLGFVSTEGVNFTGTTTVKPIYLNGSVPLNGGFFLMENSSSVYDFYNYLPITVNDVVVDTQGTGGTAFCFDNGTSLLSSTSWKQIVSNDGRLVKVWKDFDTYKNFNIKQQPFYYTQNWVNYDASQDNSITMTNAEYTYYNDNSTTIFQTIQNNIDNSGSDLTEEDIQKIVDDAVKEILDSIPEDTGSGDTGDDSTSDNDSGTGGNGVSDLIEGIGKIFDTILSLIGKLMGVVADFTQSILDLFSGFTTFTDGFSDFLAGAFGFIPAEIWDIVRVGLSLMVLLAVIKFLRK